MLNKIKRYFNIAIDDTTHDAVINDIIENATQLQQAIDFDEALIFPCCVEDFSYYLKSGNTMFEVAQPSDGISRYSDDLFRLIKITTKARAY